MYRIIHVSPGLVIAWARLYKEGKSTAEIAKMSGISQATVHKILKRHGVKLRPVGRPVGYKLKATNLLNCDYV